MKKQNKTKQIPAVPMGILTILWWLVFFGLGILALIWIIKSIIGLL